MIPCKCNSTNLIVYTHGLKDGRGYIECRDCGRSVVRDRAEIESAVKEWNTVKSFNYYGNFNHLRSLKAKHDIADMFSQEEIKEIEQIRENNKGLRCFRFGL